MICVSFPPRRDGGQDLARQLEDLLDDTPFDITTLSRDPQGNEADELPADLDQLATFDVGGRPVDLQMQRSSPQPGVEIWQVSAASVALIPKAHQAVAETPFEKKLPQALVTFEVFDTPVWRWIALLLMAAAIWFAASLAAHAVALIPSAWWNIASFHGPVRLALAIAAFRVAMELAPPATIARAVIGRVLALAFALSVAWAGAVLVNGLSERWRGRLDPRQQAVTLSFLPLIRQAFRVSLFLIAVLSVLNAWGYNTTTILAGLGVGGIAIALAAQKTIEDLFGGISVISDRPVLVGDACKFDSGTGTVMHIGLRSTRIRTPDRTIVSVPNSKFAAMTLENISGRDKILFHPTFNLRLDTTSDQLLKVLSSFRQILASHPKVEPGKTPVRFAGVGTYSLDVEIFAYVTTPDYDEYLVLQEDLLFKLLRAVEEAGTHLAVPVQESLIPPSSNPG